MVDPDDHDTNNGSISEHSPATDIDHYIEDCNFRIERMSSDAVWICAYTEDDDEPDHHYDLHITNERGIHITHRKEKPRTN
jgi:hypothetical protein